MVFSPEWEETYKGQRHTNSWPWSDLITHVMRYVRPSSPTFKVLELGPGNGPNIQFFKSLNVDYHGIEGSESAQKKILEKHPNLAGRVIVGDFTRDIPFVGKFDLIVDRGSLTHNSTAAIRSCIGIIHDRLKPHGSFVGVSWFSKQSSEFANGEPLEGDLFTLKKINTGRSANLGRVHFADRDHIVDLFAAFEVVALNEFVRTYRLPNPGYREAFWNFVMRKRGG